MIIPPINEIHINMYDVGQLVWILSSNESGEIMSNHAPVLIIAKYVGPPRSFLQGKDSCDKHDGPNTRTVYDILVDGIIERSIDEEWLTVLSDRNVIDVVTNSCK